MDLGKYQSLESWFKRIQINRGILSLLCIVLLSGIVLCNADRTASDWNSMGESYYNNGNYDDAIAAYSNAVDINPNFAEAWNNLGLAYEMVGRYNDAVSAFRHAVAVNPRYVEAWNNLGDVYEKLGRSDDARDAYQRARTTSNSYNSVPPYQNHPYNNPNQGPGNQPFGPQGPGMNPGPRGR